MVDPAAHAEGIDALEALAGLPNLESAHDSGQRILPEKRPSQIYGFLNPLRSVQVTLVSENELEWLDAQDETELLQSPAFREDHVKVVLMCCNCTPNSSLARERAWSLRKRRGKSGHRRASWLLTEARSDPKKYS